MGPSAVAGEQKYVLVLQLFGTRIPCQNDWQKNTIMHYLWRFDYHFILPSFEELCVEEGGGGMAVETEAGRVATG